jgi:ubiquinol-cytochrome c reductase cytochrome c subunit
VKRISRHRRHKAVAPLLLIFALLGIGTTFQVAGAATSSPMTAEERTAAIAEGKEIFLRG